MRLNSPEYNVRGALPHSFAMATAVVLAIGLAVISGYVLAYTGGPRPSDGLTLAGWAAVAIIALQIALFAWLVHRSYRASVRARAEERLAELRSRQLELVTALTLRLDSESRPRRIVTRAIEFFIERLGVRSAVYWKPGVDGEPALPFLARSVVPAARAVDKSEKAYRAVVTRHSARDMRPLYLHGPRREPVILDAHAPPESPLHMFLPLPGDEVCEGLLELQADTRTWGSAEWLSLELLAGYVGRALSRGRRYQEMQEQADRDFVTGAFSHRFMQNYLQRLMSASRVRRRPVAVCLLDVDGFKTFNDTLGHGAGDRVLQAVAAELQRVAGRRGVVGRSGGDEFIVVLPDQSHADGEAFKDALRDWLNSPATEMEAGLRISVSCGVAVFPYDGETRQEILAVADSRLYRAKHGGSGLGRRVASRSERAVVGVYGVLDRILDTLQQRDGFTRAHAEKTAEYAVALAHELGLSTAAQRTLRLAGLLHDIGKIAQADRSLDGPEDASLEQQMLLVDHLVADVPNAEEVRRLIREHHERWDGGGYPRGLRGEAIPYLARVLAVADVYSAIRVRRRELTEAAACRRLQREAGRTLDPQLVTELVRMQERREAAVKAVRG